jgi:hypothetical protein
MFDYFFFIVSLIIPGIYISKVLKTTIMGHTVDKTFAYYTSSSFLTPLDTEICIQYIFYGNEYHCYCNSENFGDCIDFIQYRRPWTPRPSRVAEFAYFQSKDGDGPIEPVTDEIKSLAGPCLDFYQNTPFQARKGTVCGLDGKSDDKILHIIDNYGKTSAFKGNEFLELPAAA